MTAYSEDHIVLAAEYALGTLDADERAQVEAMMSVDKDFTAMVQAWEQKLGVLNQMVGSVEPRPDVWDKIRTAVGLSEPQAPLVLPDTPNDVAARILDRLRAIIADLDWSAFSPAMRVTISAGVATLRPVETADTFLARADNALYAAKAQGRNRIASV